MTYFTFMDAFSKGNHIMTETGQMDNMNLSSIFTYLLQITARFTERYADDVLYSIESIRHLCETVYPLEHDIDEIFVFGIRENGVDGNLFTIQRCIETMVPYHNYMHVKNTYRRILAVRIHVTKTDEDGNQIYGDPHITCELKDITDSMTEINPEDTVFGTPYLHLKQVTLRELPLTGKEKPNGSK